MFCPFCSVSDAVQRISPPLEEVQSLYFRVEGILSISLHSLHLVPFQGQVQESRVLLRLVLA